MGGAAAVCAALELLPELAGGERRAVRVWAAAGIAGAALGPAIGGLLTQLISWQSIFVVQVPLALIPVLVVAGRGAPAMRPRARACRTSRPTSRSGCCRPGSRRCSSCSCCCSSRAGACRRSPPRSSSRSCPPRPLAAGPFERRVADTRVRAAAGTLLGAGGVAALGLLPGAGWQWTLAAAAARRPRARALAGGAHRGRAWPGRSPAAIHGGFTIASRHAGVVLGLRPADAGVRRRSQQAARPRHAEGRRARARRAHRRAHEGRSRPAHRDRHPPSAGPAARHPQLVRGRQRQRARAPGAASSSRHELNDQLDRAATSSFERSFLFAALLALSGADTRSR